MGRDRQGMIKGNQTKAQGSPSMVRMVVVLLLALCGWATPVPLAATSSDSKLAVACLARYSHTQTLAFTTNLRAIGRSHAKDPFACGTLKWQTRGSALRSAAQYSRVHPPRTVLLMERVAISSGKGNNMGIPLAVAMAQSFALQAPKVCNIESIYRDDALEWQAADMLGLHAASGMRILSGCPARLLFGVEGGCEACKCVVPSLAQMKRVCPYYGSAGRATIPRSAWELTQELKLILNHCSSLVLLSVSEDIDLPPDSPSTKQRVLYQVELAKEALECGIAEVVLIGPSDGIAGGVKEFSDHLKRYQHLSAGLDRRASQLKGLDVRGKNVMETELMKMKLLTEAATPLRPLAAEAALRELGVNLRTVRAPAKHLLSADVADIVASFVTKRSGQQQLILSPEDQK